MADISKINPNGDIYDIKDTTARAGLNLKADKVSNATANNFAGLDSNGNLTDSGKKASDFLPSNTPIPDEVTANPTGTATGTLTKLGIGSDIYSIEGGSGIDGSIVTPTDVVATWLACARLHQSYTTLNEVLADSAVLSALMASTNAVDYLVRSTTWASTICADETAMNYIGENNYCADILLADSTWRTAICNSTYFEQVLNAKVPVMTSNTTPSGEANIVSVYGAGNEAYRAFDNNANTWAVPEDSTSDIWISYKFTQKSRLYKFRVLFNTTVANLKARLNSLKCEGSVDGVTWDTIDTITISDITTNNLEVIVNSNNEYSQYRILCTKRITNRVGFTTVEFIGRSDLPPVDDRINTKADTTLIAPVQTTLTASKAYAVGEQFVYNQVLYKVTQAIAQGAQITIGTNAVVAGSVTEQLLQDTRVSLLWNSEIGSLQLADNLSKYRLINVEMIFKNNQILGTYQSILVPCNIFKLHSSVNDYYKFEVYTTTRNSYTFYVLDDNHIYVTEKPSSSTSNWYLRIYGIK